MVVQRAVPIGVPGRARAPQTAHHYLFVKEAKVFTARSLNQPIRPHARKRRFFLQGLSAPPPVVPGCRPNRELALDC